MSFPGSPIALLARDEEAQASTEYILILFVVISIFLLVYMSFLKPFMSQFVQLLGNAINNMMFPADFHHFPVHR